MSILNLKKQNNKEIKNTSKKVEIKTVSKVNTKVKSLSSGRVDELIIVRPHLTEKAYDLQQKGIYVFRVSKNATKKEVEKSVKALYGLEPRTVRITKIYSKTILLRGVKGHTKSGKKAYVYLKHGDKIELA